jgi:uncharacterized membrane protein YhaH (DUF805 family)
MMVLARRSLTCSEAKMDFQEAVKTCLMKKYADFTGRATRPEFWWFVLAQFVASAVLSLVSSTLATLLALGLLIPGLAAGARRLHDLGKSGWLQLLGLIPVLGWILLIYWAAQPGEPGANQYGEAPAAPGASMTAGAPGQQ